MTELYKAVDVSEYQGDVDWPKVKAGGIGAVFVRVAWAGYNGGLYLKDGVPGCDPQFKANMVGATAAGLHVGAYIFSYCTSPEAARRAVREAAALLAPYNVTLPLAWDYEYSRQYASYGKARNTEICRAALEEIAKQGYIPLLYTYRSFADSYLNMDALHFDFWLADWEAKETYDGPYTVWQYTNQGNVPGISGRVDISHIYKDYPALGANGTD